MKRAIGYRWHLRQVMATRGMFSTTDVAPHLERRGINLSAAQVYRLVTGTPERLSLQTLAALCDILGCTPADLIEPVVESRAARKVSGEKASMRRPSGVVRPRPARITKR